MIICDGSYCENKEAGQSNLCCNDCEYKECKNKCNASKYSCHSSREIN